MIWLKSIRDTGRKKGDTKQEIRATKHYGGNRRHEPRRQIQDTRHEIWQEARDAGHETGGTRHTGRATRDRHGINGRRTRAQHTKERRGTADRKYQIQDAIKDLEDIRRIVDTGHVIRNGDTGHGTGNMKADRRNKTGDTHNIRYDIHYSGRDACHQKGDTNYYVLWKGDIQLGEGDWIC